MKPTENATWATGANIPTIGDETLVATTSLPLQAAHRYNLPADTTSPSLQPPCSHNLPVATTSRRYNLPSLKPPRRYNRTSPATTSPSQQSSVAMSDRQLETLPQEILIRQDSHLQQTPRCKTQEWEMKNVYKYKECSLLNLVKI